MRGVATESNLPAMPNPVKAISYAGSVRRQRRLRFLGGSSLALASLLFAAEDPTPLVIKLPMEPFRATPADIPLNEHIETRSDLPRPPFLTFKGAKLVSEKKPVTLSDPKPFQGDATFVTDGNKEAGDANVLEMHRKLQWVQIDLEAPHKIAAIVVWHAYDMEQITKDVILQVADDPDFTKNVRTLYSNDYDNSAGLGVGKDKEYFENYEGRLVDGKGEVARYVRLYSQGSTYTALNRYTEVEAYGLPVR
jgi:hypothetical protein